ncbi:MAG: hypothetical protein ACR2IE_19675 [Candidatus Sumerlaeaceae bacterium]
MFILRYIVNHLKRHYKVEQGPEFIEALHQINKPSEVTVPNELIPSGVLIQLRGLFNLHTLSINSDWIWPYWMEQQGNPKSSSFIPRAMSLAWINLTHRNWTGIGVLGSTREGVVDPRGMVTPWMQGWSLDTWIRRGNNCVFPSRLRDADVQQILRENMPFIQTRFMAGDLGVEEEAWCFRNDNLDYAVHEVHLHNPTRQLITIDLVFAVRPANPEGLSLINNIVYNTRGFWNIDNSLALYFVEKPDRVLASSHTRGDVSLHLDEEWDDNSVHDPAGLATAASIYRLTIQPGETATRYAIMPLEPSNPRFFPLGRFTPEFLENAKQETLLQWRDKLGEGVTMDLPDERYQACFDANRAFLLLLNDGHEITAGPLTYHRHWFRDAAYMLNALNKIGYGPEVARNLEFIPLKQWKNGYFCSQKGEWDSNGEAIWTIVEHWRLTGDIETLRQLYPSIRRAALWIEKKRHDVTVTKQKPRGLLPAGFSAEHLGPNDYYYWDNFWCLRGMFDAADAALALGFEKDHKVLLELAQNYLRDLEQAMNRDIEHSKSRALPAAPGRRPDAGMIGNIAAAYPLKLFRPEDTPWLRNTIEFIRDHLFHDEGFYQQMIHSGVNSYLTLQMAQCMLLSGDIGAYKLIDYMLKLATSTWCWPEAIHPRTFGGCMGDGHHGWAASEWLLMMRNLVIHEQGDVLQVTRLLPAEWCHPGQRVAINNAPTYFGDVSVAVDFAHESETLTITANWRRQPKEIHWFLPAEGRRVVGDYGNRVRLHGTMAFVDPSITHLKLEVDLEHAHSIAEGDVPGLEEMPQGAT